jgi:ABC-type transporter Mla MlaB component
VDRAVLKIRALAAPEHFVEFALIGDLCQSDLAMLAETVGEAQKCGKRIVLDLTGIFLVDRAAMRLLLEYLEIGVELRNSPRYVSTWIDQERQEEDS